MSDEPRAPEDRAAAPPIPATPAPPLGSAEAKMRAALASSGLRDALRELDDVIEEPDPPAPDPVVVLPDKKGEVLVADTEAAAAYVQPTVRRGGPVPQDTLTRVHVDARVDPRKQPTERRLQSEVLAAAQGAAQEAAQAARNAEIVGSGVTREESPWAKPATAAATAIDPAALPSSHAPSSRAPSSRAPSWRGPSSRPPPSGLARPASPRAEQRKRGVMAAGLVVSGTLAIVVFLVLRSGTGANELTAASGAASTMGTARLSAMGATGVTTEPDVEAATTGTTTTATTVGSATQTASETTDTAMDATTGAAASSPRTTTTAAPWTTGSRPAPGSTSDVYVDAAPPRPSAPSAVPSTGPSALPSALTTTTAGQPPPYEEP